MLVLWEVEEGEAIGVLEVELRLYYGELWEEHCIFVPHELDFYCVHQCDFPDILDLFLDLSRESL